MRDENNKQIVSIQNEKYGSGMCSFDSKLLLKLKMQYFQERFLFYLFIFVHVF